MSFSLTWLPGVLKSAGLKVAEVPGWQTRGHGDVGPIVGVICHHTAGTKNGNMPSLKTVTDGRPGLSGPLAQLGLGRDGTYYVIAAGKCYHAGKGSWQGQTQGNTRFIGIEAENTGLANDTPWPAVQLDAYQRGVAAILAHIGKGAEFCAGHKEFALPKGRKTDPDFDMDAFRAAVAAHLKGTAPPPSMIPAVAPPSTRGVPAGMPTLRRKASGDLVKQVQAKVGVSADGDFGAKTEAAVRTFQREHGLTPDGIVGPATWVALAT